MATQLAQIETDVYALATRVHIGSLPSVAQVLFEELNCPSRAAPA